ncbi:MAG: hypothetical protein WBB73_08875 [Candidatus Aminicenantaceae bacterium]
MSKKLLVLVLVCILVFPLGLTAKEKKGADLLVEKLDGTQVRGELITVKDSSLLLLDRESGADVSVDVKDIKVITSVKKSKALQGAGLGFLISAVSLSVLAWATDEEFFLDPEGGGPLVLALVFGIPGLLVGTVVGAIVGTDKTIQIEGKIDSEIKEALDYLRTKARVPDYQ